MITKPAIPADLKYNPYDKDIDENPYGVWKRLRDEAPLYYNEEYDFYALSRYDDVAAALHNWQDYSSARGTVLELINTDNPDKNLSYDDGNLGMMIFTDPPGHDIARNLVNQHFTPKAVHQYEQRVRTLCHTLFAKVEGKTEFDLAEDIIRPIPPMMIGEILGVPEEDQAYLGRLVDESLAFDPEAGPDDIVGGVRQGNDSHKIIGEYIARLVADRTANPTGDVLSQLLASDVKLDDGSIRKLDTREVISFFMLLQGAGSETTARALSWAGVLLARYPEERQKLVQDPGKIRTAVEEILRFEPPSPIQARFVKRDVEWHGITVPKGSKIALLNGSAGRDERRFDNPDVINVDRPNIRHLSFGFGKHVCLGASLARLEMRVVLEELLQRYPEWQVDEAKVRLVHTTTVRGPATVPIMVGTAS